MGLDALLAQLEREHATALEEVRAAAEARAAETRAAGTAALSRDHHAWLAGEEARARGAADAVVQDARTATRRQVLHARELMLQRVLQRATAKLGAAAEDPAYLGGLAGELARAHAFLDEEEVVLRCSPGLASVLARPGLRIEPAPDAPVGFTLATADGSVRVDATLESRLGRQWAQLAIAVLERLGATP